CGGALVGEDEIERIGGQDIAVEVQVGIERLEVFLDRLRRGTGGAGRAVETGADHAADPQRRRVDGDRPALKRETTTDAVDDEGKVQPGAQLHALQRTRLA